MRSPSCPLFLLQSALDQEMAASSQQREYVTAIRGKLL